MTQQELDSFFAAVLRVEKEDPLRWQPCLAPIVAEQDYDTGLAQTTPGRISFQGRLTDSNNNPLTPETLVNSTTSRSRP